MKQLLSKHFSRPYAMVILACVLFGLIMTGLIPIGNGYFINPQCTENGKFIEHTGSGCGGFTLFGMEHFLWHPRVTIAVGVVLLFFEAAAWAALMFATALLLPLLRDLEFRSNPFAGTAAKKTWLAILLGVLLTIHFAAVPVQSKTLQADAACATEAALCEPCPGVVATTKANPVREDYGWPFQIVKRTYAADACGMQPVMLRSAIDPLAAMFNMVIWSVISYGVLHWVSKRSNIFGEA